MYTALANLVLVVHASFVVFVVLGVPCILLGHALQWHWVRLRWLRVLHLAAIVVVAAQSWAGLICPLTTLEQWLRRNADATTYSGGFIEHWLNQFLYWDLPAWVFVAAYSLFAILVTGTWFWVPPFKSTAVDIGADTIDKDATNDC